MFIVHIADITMFYAPASGGVRTYLDAKHRRLGIKPGIRHSLLIPGSSLSEQDGVYTVPAPALPFGKGYRFPLRLAPWRNVLQDLQPDLIEVGDPYLTAWAALDARRQLDVPVIGFYHSDLPLLVSNRMGNWVTTNVEAYVSKLYGNFDRVLAPSQVMADKLTGLGVKNVFVQPLGVDLQTFHPSARDPGLRAELGIDENTHLLIFAGRGSKEKNLPVLLDCMKRLGRRYHLLLVGSSMPALVPDNVTVVDEFCPAAQIARLMASADALLHAGDQETFGLSGNRQRSMRPAVPAKQFNGDGQRGTRTVQFGERHSGQTSPQPCRTALLLGYRGHQPVGALSRRARQPLAADCQWLSP
jgi:alpha-1,6-mannosyltransferase